MPAGKGREPRAEAAKIGFVAGLQGQESCYEVFKEKGVEALILLTFIQVYILCSLCCPIYFLLHIWNKGNQWNLSG